jgi:hypothetical protein
VVASTVRVSTLHEDQGRTGRDRQRGARSRSLDGWPSLSPRTRRIFARADQRHCGAVVTKLRPDDLVPALYRHGRSVTGRQSRLLSVGATSTRPWRHGQARRAPLAIGDVFRRRCP